MAASQKQSEYAKKAHASEIESYKSQLAKLQDEKAQFLKDTRELIKARDSRQKIIDENKAKAANDTAEKE